jgi:hypothetical protein
MQRPEDAPVREAGAPADIAGAERLARLKKLAASTYTRRPAPEDLDLPAPASAAKDIASLDPAVERERAHNDDLRQDTKLKRLYAYWFIGILAVQLLLMNGVFVAVGIGCLKFSEPVLQMYMAGTLAEVFGVVYVITRYLFSKKDSTSGQA